MEEVAVRSASGALTPTERRNRSNTLSGREKTVYDSEQRLLEAELRKPPTLKEIGIWLSLYAPENLLFREAVVRFQKAFDKNDLPKAHKIQQHIVSFFTGSDSAFEVHGKKQQQALQPGSALRRDAFDDTLKTLEQDLARALTSLYQADIFLSFLKNRELLTAVTKDFLMRKEAADEGAAYTEDDPLRSVRSKYGDATEQMVLKRVNEVGMPYNYRVERATGGQQIGWCRQEGDDFIFFDLEGQVLRRYNMSTLLNSRNRTLGVKDGSGAAGSKQTTSSPAADQASSGCFGRRAPAIVEDRSLWFLKMRSEDREYGPVTAQDVQLWWKYHLIPDEVLVKPAGTSAYRRVDEEPFFEPKKKLQLIDPTMLSELGRNVDNVF